MSELNLQVPLTLQEWLGDLFDWSQLKVSDDVVRSTQVLPVGELELDSRKVMPGGTFIATSGAQADRNEYVTAAITAGATVVLKQAGTDDEDALCELEQRGQTVVLVVPDLHEKVSELAARFYGVTNTNVQQVGVTGTNGKTTCAQWLAKLLVTLGKSAASIGTLGYGFAANDDAASEHLKTTGFTTPDPVDYQRIIAELADQGAEYVVSEVSSHGLEQGRVAAVPFKVAMFTNIGRDHLDYHATMKAYVEAKTRLMAFESLQAAIINIDDVYASKFIYALHDHVRPITYGIEHSDADFCARNIKANQAGLKFDLVTPQGCFAIETPVWGHFNVYNLLAIVAALYALDFPLDQVVAALSSLSVVPGRLEKVNVESDVAVLVDFAHTADALTASLSAVKEHTSGKLWCVFGCGGDRDKGKRPLMAQAAEALADHVVVTSDNPRTESPDQIIEEINAGFNATTQVILQKDRKTAIEVAITEAAAGDCILIAGKGHEDYQLIGDKKYPFSDLLVAQKVIQLRQQGGAA